MFSKKQISDLTDTLEMMDFSGEDIDSELKNLIDYIESLPEKITLYRILKADSKEDIDLEELGSHYSPNKKDLLSSHSYVTGIGDDTFLVTVIADKSQIDFFQTIHNNILYPNEQEVTLKNKGKGVKIKSVKKIKVA
jgi:hypothetical protein